MSHAGGWIMIAVEAARTQGHDSAEARIRWCYSRAKIQLNRSPTTPTLDSAPIALAAIAGRFCPHTPRFDRSCFMFCFAIVSSRVSCLHINHIGQNAGEAAWTYRQEGTEE
jgi:hypothetical protein